MRNGLENISTHNSEDQMLSSSKTRTTVNNNLHYCQY